MEYLNLQELSRTEMNTISGGSGWKYVVKAGKWLLEAAAVHDAIDSFKDGWDGCAPKK